MSKDRISVTVDPDLVALAEQAVAEGRAKSVSAYVNTALRDLQRRQQRARSALTGLLHEHELADPDAAKASRERMEAMVAARTGAPARKHDQDDHADDSGAAA